MKVMQNCSKEKKRNWPMHILALIKLQSFHSILASKTARNKNSQYQYLWWILKRATIIFKNLYFVLILNDIMTFSWKAWRVLTNPLLYVLIYLLKLCVVGALKVAQFDDIWHLFQITYLNEEPRSTFQSDVIKR